MALEKVDELSSLALPQIAGALIKMNAWVKEAGKNAANLMTS